MQQREPDTFLLQSRDAQKAGIANPRSFQKIADIVEIRCSKGVAKLVQRIDPVGSKPALSEPGQGCVFVGAVIPVCSPAR